MARGREGKATRRAGDAPERWPQSPARSAKLRPSLTPNGGPSFSEWLIMRMQYIYIHIYTYTYIYEMK